MAKKFASPAFMGNFMHKCFTGQVAGRLRVVWLFSPAFYLLLLTLYKIHIKNKEILFSGKDRFLSKLNLVCRNCVKNITRICIDHLHLFSATNTLAGVDSLQEKLGRKEMRKVKERNNESGYTMLTNDICSTNKRNRVLLPREQIPLIRLPENINSSVRKQNSCTCVAEMSTEEPAAV